jgi:hypothetical protein
LQGKNNSSERQSSSYKGCISRRLVYSFVIQGGDIALINDCSGVQLLGFKLGDEKFTLRKIGTGIHLKKIGVFLSRTFEESSSTNLSSL